MPYAEFIQEDRQVCDGCGRDLNDDNVHPCPLCCPSPYAPGSEECDWCPYEQECFGELHRRGLA